MARCLLESRDRQDSRSHTYQESTSRKTGGASNVLRIRIVLRYAVLPHIGIAPSADVYQNPQWAAGAVRCLPLRLGSLPADKPLEGY